MFARTSRENEEDLIRNSVQVAIAVAVLFTDTQRRERILLMMQIVISFFRKETDKQCVHFKPRHESGMYVGNTKKNEKEVN